jgi:hypothetical protein
MTVNGIIRKEYGGTGLCAAAARVHEHHFARASVPVEGRSRSKALDRPGLNAGGGEGVAHAAPASNHAAGKANEAFHDPSNRNT